MAGCCVSAFWISILSSFSEEPFEIFTSNPPHLPYLITNLGLSWCLFGGFIILLTNNPLDYRIITFFIIITCLRDIVLILLGEILPWSLMGVKASKDMSELRDFALCESPICSRNLQNALH